MLHTRLVVTLALLWVVLVSSPALAATADEVIEQHLQACGGRNAWQQVSTLRIHGVVTDKTGQRKDPMGFTVERRQPGQVRFELTVLGNTAVQAFDGKTGWAIMPSSPDPVPLNDALVAELQAQSQIESPLLDLDPDTTVTLVATEQVNEGTAYHLRLSGGAGGVIDTYLDTESKLEVKRVRRRQIGDQEVEITWLLRHYREVGDLLLPHTIEVSNNHDGKVNLVTYTAIELDVELDEHAFQQPGTGEDQQPADATGDPEGTS